jgi:hypothetical protein
MNTTNLFVELIVIGMAAVVWLCFLAASIFPLKPIELLSTTVSASALAPTLAASYILGIAIDRLADFVFQHRDHKLRARRFSSSDYQRARTVIYAQSESLSGWFQYCRSRLRICRGSAINTVLITIAVNAFIWTRRPAPEQALLMSLTCSLAGLTLAVGFWAAWERLTNSEYQRLEQEWVGSKDQSPNQALQRTRAAVTAPASSPPLSPASHAGAAPAARVAEL